MIHKSVASLVECMDKAYNGPYPDEELEGYVDSPEVEEARAVLSGAINVLRKNPDVDIECHFEEGTPG